MVLSLLLKLIYPPPASIIVTAMSVISFASLSNAGWMEIMGKHMEYSKFVGISSNSTKKTGKLPSRVGMTIIYAPAFLVGVSSFLIFPIGEDLRFTLLRSAITIHFFKRVLEVLFLHKYSGTINNDVTIPISISYFISAATMIYAQHLSQLLPEPAIDLKYVGIPLFLLGICGNFYHHYLLTKLRPKGEKRYSIPQGGLFSLVICPHYLFEILVFFGISCISQTLYAFAYTLGSAFYLMGRSCATRRWYESKFEDFPQHVKALIPYIF